MLYNIFVDFFMTKDGSLLHFAYLLFRTFGALFTSLVFTFLATSKFIKVLTKEGKFQPIRKEGIKRHIATKSKTPTMGGLIMLLSIVFSMLLWANLKNQHIWISLFAIVAFGTLGLIDDLMKVFWHDTDGFKGINLHGFILR